MAATTAQQPPWPPFRTDSGPLTLYEDEISSYAYHDLPNLIPNRWTTWKKAVEIIEENADSVDEDNCKDLVLFRNVSQENFQLLEAKREKIGHHVRFTFFGDEGVLIIKIPGAKHETSHGTFVRGLLLSLGSNLAFPHADNLELLGAAKFNLANNVEKEGAAALRPKGRRKEFPSVVIEVGVSVESLGTLRTDAAIWLLGSAGAVKAVILVHVDVPGNIITIEKWILRRPATQRIFTRATETAAGYNAVPTRVQSIRIHRQATSNTNSSVLPCTLANTRPTFTPQPGSVPINAAASSSHKVATNWTCQVRGGPLILELSSLYDGQTSPPIGDIVFTEEYLAFFCDTVLSS